MLSTEPQEHRRDSVIVFRLVQVIFMKENTATDLVAITLILYC